jgi:hypothetical protein
VVKKKGFHFPGAQLTRNAEGHEEEEVSEKQSILTDSSTQNPTVLSGQAWTHFNAGAQHADLVAQVAKTIRKVGELQQVGESAVLNVPLLRLALAENERAGDRLRRALAGAARFEFAYRMATRQAVKP